MRMRSIVKSVSTTVLRGTMLGPSITKPGHLVACLAPLRRNNSPDDDAIVYKLVSYPIQHLITKSRTTEVLKPDAEFTMRDEMDGEFRHWCHTLPSGKAWSRLPPYCDVRFLKVGGGDLVYAIGGDRISQAKYPYGYLHQAEGLGPQDLSCLLLSASPRNSEVRMQTLSPMRGKKYNPIVAEIGGLIYVITSPSYEYPPAPDHQCPLFEVYDPSKNEWASLPDPPLLKPVNEMCIPGLSCVVIGARLYVSSRYRGSCFYDTELKTWEPCQLFSNIIMRGRSVVSAGCGRRFPFMWSPILYNEKFLLGVGHDYKFPVLAFYMVDEHEAVEVPFEFDTKFPVGFPMQPIVDLGDGYFVVMLDDWKHYRDIPYYDCYFDPPESWFGVTVVTFKLQWETENNGDFLLRGKIVSVHKMTTTSENPFNGNEEDMGLVGAFVHHPNH